MSSILLTRENQELFIQERTCYFTFCKYYRKSFVFFYALRSFLNKKKMFTYYVFALHLHDDCTWIEKIQMSVIFQYLT